MEHFVIDISYWQNGIDFDALKDAGVEGVIMKITEGTEIEDTWYHYVSECERLNLPWGVYCFSHAQTPQRAEEEANEVLYLLGDKKPPMGIWYDVEHEDCFEDGVDTTAVCSAFICYCNDHGHKVGIYTSTLKCTDYMVNSIRPHLLADYVPWWIADYRGYCGFEDAYPTKHVAGWQYTDSQWLCGYQVDHNHWYDDLEMEK